MVVLDGAYVGLAPVPGPRVNVGIVLGRQWREPLRTYGAEVIAQRVLALAAPRLAGLPRCDRIAGAAPLAHRVTRRSGRGWLLAGDAAGFLDPFTGEGLHRALVSAELAAAAIERDLQRRAGGLDPYDRAMRRRFMAKDVVTVFVQAFLARPALLEYAARRLAARDRVRETMGLVIGDLVPASRGFDPRFLAALLRP
jgi:flavin-dependent dehydrogenase